MSSNLKDDQLKNVTGGENTIVKPATAKYDVGFSYDSPWLYGANHKVTITVKGYNIYENGNFEYVLERVETMYMAPTLKSTITKPESYIDDRKYD